MSSVAAIFLDRDGVINVDTGYPHEPEHLVLIPGAVAAVKKANDRGVLAVVVSNQSGVARGLFSESDVIRFNERIQECLAVYGAKIDAFYFCPYHPDGVVEKYRMEHRDRKPLPGMIERAAYDLGIDLNKSIMIGDKDSDMLAASAAGIPGFKFGSGRLDQFVDDVFFDKMDGMFK